MSCPGFLHIRSQPRPGTTSNFAVRSVYLRLLTRSIVTDFSSLPELQSAYCLEVTGLPPLCCSVSVIVLKCKESCFCLRESLNDFTHEHVTSTKVEHCFHTKLFARYHASLISIIGARKDFQRAVLNCLLVRFLEQRGITIELYNRERRSRLLSSIISASPRVYSDQKPCLSYLKTSSPPLA